MQQATARKPLDVVEWFTYEYVLLCKIFKDEENGVEYWTAARWYGIRKGETELLSFRLPGHEKEKDLLRHLQQVQRSSTPKKKCVPSTKKSRRWLQVERTAKVRPKKKRVVIKTRKNKKKVFVKKTTRKAFHKNPRR